MEKYMCEQRGGELIPDEEAVELSGNGWNGAAFSAVLHSASATAPWSEWLDRETKITFLEDGRFPYTGLSTDSGFCIESGAMHDVDSSSSGVREAANHAEYHPIDEDVDCDRYRYCSL